MSPADSILAFDDVHLVFRGGLRAPVWALRGLTLEVPAGAVMGLLGPNGAGKTTAISCMLGLLEPTVGSVHLWGQRVSSTTPRHGSRCGVLLEDTRLPPFLSVDAALRSTCALRGIEEVAAEIERVVALAGVGDLLTRRVAVLSKGQARRVGLAAALVGDPPLLVLDEPSAGLDAEARIEFETLIRTLRSERRTMLIASHLLGDVEATCSHIAVIVDGRVALAGRALDLLEEARRGQASDVHVDASCAAQLDASAIGHESSRFPGLVLIRCPLSDEELFAKLASLRVVPRRVEPRASVVSLYLEATRKEPAA
ncbi:MAG: ABC transporter ATP-binding protein [Labilithrix sp.]|nr:ABC transporter ATP-binding protein [Labilithrix sp.]